MQVSLQKNRNQDLKKQLYVVLATICVGLGALGIFVPLLPTTPFLLLATYLYMKSSRTRLKWLLRHKHLGPYISSYLSREGIPMKLKIRTITLLWATMITTMIFATDKIFVRVMLGVIATAVTSHLLMKKTRKKST